MATDGANSDQCDGMASNAAHEAEEASKQCWQCCCNFHTALAAVFDLLHSERRAAEDREKRLLVRIGDLSRTVADLSTNMEQLTKPVEKVVNTERTTTKKAKKKAQKAGSPAPGAVAADTDTVDLRDHASDHQCDDATRTPTTGPSHVQIDDSNHKNSNNSSSNSTLDLLRFEEMPDDDDASWRIMTSKKPEPKKAVLFVGKLEGHMTEEKVKLFVERRGAEAGRRIKVFGCKIFRKEESVSARLVVDEDSVKLVARRKFFPKPVYTRDWDFKKYPQNQ